MLCVVVGWSQEGNSPADDQRSLPTLELSDVVVVGVEQAGHPQGIRHRELPGVPPAIILSTIVDTSEFPRTAIGARHIPGMIPIGATHFLTTDQPMLPLQSTHEGTPPRVHCTSTGCPKTAPSPGKTATIYPYAAAEVLW